jgi:organic hydroperoxide reductase OsmC/OhrA
MTADRREHRYQALVTWTGDLGTGTSRYKDFSRDHDIVLDGKVAIKGSSDPLFRGDETRANPEQMLVAALSSCHMLWYLHLCAQAGIIVKGYRDEARGTMQEDRTGSGRFSAAELNPHVLLEDPGRQDDAQQLHEAAHKKCFIARSVNFDIRINPSFSAAGQPPDRR